MKNEQSREHKHPNATPGKEEKGAAKIDATKTSRAATPSSTSSQSTAPTAPMSKEADSKPTKEKSFKPEADLDKQKRSA